MLMIEKTCWRLRSFSTLAPQFTISKDYEKHPTLTALVPEICEVRASIAARSQNVGSEAKLDSISLLLTWRRNISGSWT